MSLQGKLVEYIEQGRFLCAFVLEEAGKKLRLLNQNGREINLSSARIVHQSRERHVLAMPREDLLRQLREVAAKRNEMKMSIDLAEIWDLASQETDSVFTPRFLAELSFGEDATDDHEAAFLRSIFDDSLYFKFKDGQILVHAAEVVEQQRARLAKDQERKAFMASCAQGLAQMMAGELDQEWPDMKRCLGILEDFYLHGNEAAESSLARDVLKEAKLTRTHDVYHLLIKAGHWHKDENIPLLRYELPVAFPEEVLEAAAAIKSVDVPAMLAAGRKDFRHLPLLTIDGESTRDFDDALHVEKLNNGYLVGIHITDVASFVDPGSALFQESMTRTTSIYFADGQVPMLPPEISEFTCSLIAGEDRAALSFMVKLSPDGEVLDVDIMPSIVRVKRQLSYSEAEGLLHTDEELRSLYELSQKLLQRRLDAGAILMPIPDVNIRFGSDDEVNVDIADVDTPTRTLVAEFMVLANTLGAAYVANQQVAGLFRCQEPPRQQLIHGLEKDLFINFRQRKQLNPAQLLVKPRAHNCVGAQQYTTVTSPIRRFIDLVMQHQIISLRLGKGARFSDKELRDMIPRLIAAQSKVNLVKRMRHRYWILRYLEQHIGERLDALVIDRGARRYYVVLLDVLLECDLPANQAINAQPGEEVSVRIAKVSPLDDLLRLEW